MKQPFKVGDRVKAYGGIEVPAASDKFKFSNRGTVGTVVELFHNAATIDTEEYGCISAHFKQLCRLKKRERRRYWINPAYLPSPYGVTVSTSSTGPVIASTAPVEGFVEVQVRKQPPGSPGK